MFDYYSYIPVELDSMLFDRWVLSFLRKLLPVCSGQKMGAAVSSETLSIYHTRLCHIPEIHGRLFMSAGWNDTGLMPLFRVRLWKRRW